MLTILIATKNRSNFLTELLSYYAEAGYEHWISIGDSSDSEHVKPTMECIKKFKDKLKIKYTAKHNLIGTVFLKELSENIQTPYAVYTGDDDYLVPSSLNKCIEYLNNHKDYVGANGVSATVLLDKSSPENAIQSAGKYPQRAIEEESPTLRLTSYFQNYFVKLFTVHRTETWKNMFSHFTSVPNSSFSNTAFAGELLPGGISVIQGKTHHLDCFYLVRLLHTSRYKLYDVYDWITNPEWQTAYQTFRKALRGDLMRIGNVGENEAEESIKQALWAYLKNGLYVKFEQQYMNKNQKISQNIAGAIKQIPGVRGLYGKLKVVIFSSTDLSLPTLLSSRSKYHADFIPVYKSILKIK